MKSTTALLLLIFISFQGFCQDIISDKQMVYNLTLDTMLVPDYYNVQISVAEFSRTERVSKRNYRTVVVTLDSLSPKLMEQLSSLGFKSEIQKSAITEIDRPENYYYYSSESDKKLFQVTYTFKITNKDSVDYLFKNIDKQFVSAMQISPALIEATVDKAKQALVVKGTAIADKYASQIAQQMNQKIIKSKYNIVFYDGGPYQFGYYRNTEKKFVIDYKDIKYQLSLSYTYSLAQK